MTKWEQICVTIPPARKGNGYQIDDEGFNGTLKSKGDEGFELVGFQLAATTIYATFKRPVKKG